MVLSYTSLCFFASLVAAASVANQCDNLTVTTDSGTYTGTINSNAPNVRQFLSIPFAQPPVGDLRWLPPQKPACKRSDKIDATKFPPSCPQYGAKTPTLFSAIVPQSEVNREGQSHTAGVSVKGTSEDCLYLAIWTPNAPKHKQALPVLMFMTGGSFTTGGVDLDFQLPHHWVQRTQSHIVVTINYRLNIFGFPGAAGLESQNLGLLDQRMALEWLRDNVKSFGGDPDRITLWGQSAGAASAGFQSFAFPDDPIANGFLMQSGGAFTPATSSNSHSNFSFLAANFGCGPGLSPANELACMRRISSDAIENFLVQYYDNSTAATQPLPPLSFSPMTDEKLVFSNYTARYVLGAGKGYADRAAVFGSCSNEGESLVPLPANYTVQGPDQDLANSITLLSMFCPEVQTSQIRTQYAKSSKTGFGGITYRYEYFGNFSNVSPYFWMGAYHSSDLPMIFGSHQDLTTGHKSTKEEFAVSQSMQDHVLAFAQDPVNGPAKLGWKRYDQDGLVQFGKKNAQGQVQVVQNVDASSVDAVCKSL